MADQAAHRSIDKVLKPANNLNRKVTGKQKAPTAPVVAATTTTNERTVPLADVLAIDKDNNKKTLQMEAFPPRYTIMQRHPGPALLEPARTHGIAGSNYSWSTTNIQQSRGKQPTWDDRLEQLRFFKKMNGHTQVPANGDWRPLYQWLYNNKMRKNGNFHNQPQLSQLQIDKLDELHVDWTVAKMDRKSWNENFEQLKAFKAKYGHTRVPQGGDWKPLCDWLCKNKRRKNEPFWGLPQLSLVQIRNLDEIGIDWTITIRRRRG